MNPKDRQLIDSVFAGGGEMAACMRALDWSTTPLGPVDQWPQALRICVRIVLGSGYPMAICWGPEYALLYNDAYRPIAGTKHPWSLGRGAREVYPEAWDFVGPMYDSVMAQGQTVNFLSDVLVPLHRNNYLEEVYIAFSASPLPDDDGRVCGVLNSALETTERVLEDRRRTVLRDLASRAVGARTEEELWRVSAETLGQNCLSLPFAFLYEYRPSEHQAHLVGASVETDEALRPAVIDCLTENLWRFDPALTRDGVPVELGERASSVPVPNWPAAPKEARVFPIRLGEYGEVLGFLVAGIHPGRAFDDAYRQFVHRVTEQITIGLTSARAFEQERKTAREKLRASEQTSAETSRLYLEQQRTATELQIQVDLLQQLPVAAWTLNPDGTPDFVNRVWLEFAGQTLDFVRSNPEAWMNAVHPDDRERVIRTFWEGVSTGRGFAFENRSLRSQDRTYRWHLQQAVPLHDAQGNVIKFVGTTTDIDEQKRVEESLAALDRAKTTFFSNVSHEFRTPLTLILGPLEEVQKEANERLSPERQELLVTVHRNGLRLLKLVNTLLDFSRIEAGRSQASFQPTDLAAFTAEIASAFDSALVNAGLHFSVECQAIPEPVYVDRDMWEKIVLNLLSNAYKFTFEGEVVLTLKPVDGAIELRVRDTGVGIPEEHRGRVFERFHRIENPRARSHEGTGIGLALVQELVKLHSGTVRVESTIGMGTTFTVTIPRGKDHLSAERIEAMDSLISTTIRAEAYIENALEISGAEPDVPAFAEIHSKAHPPTSSVRAATAGKREPIVLADDNADMRQYLTRLLSDRYEVHAVADGSQALEATRRLRPALVLADVMMPQLDGFGLLRAIRNDSSLAGTPVILVSARAGEESLVEGLDADADDYLVKPFAARELLARVAAHVKMANLRRENAEREERLRSDTEFEREKLQASEERLAETNRLYSELQRADAELQLQVTLLQQLPVSAWTLKPDGTPDFVNDVWLEFAGQTLDFVRSHPEAWMTAVHPEDREKALKGFWEGVRAGNGFSFETRALRARDGVYRWHLNQAVVLRDAEGKVIKFVGTTTEIDDQKRAEAELRENEHESRLIVDSIPGMVAVLSVRGEIERVSQPILDYYGKSLEELGQWATDGTVHSDDRAGFVHAFALSMATGDPIEFEGRFCRFDGVYRWFQIRGLPLRDHEGRILRWYFLQIDIDDRKRAEERVLRSEAYLEEAQHLTRIGSFSWQVEANNITWSEQLYRIYDLEPGSPLTFELIEARVHPDDSAVMKGVAESAQRAVNDFEYEYRLSMPDGSIRHLHSIAHAIHNKDGQLEYLGAVQDVTERQLAEEALTQARAELAHAARVSSLGVLTASIAHEVNQPLSGIITNASTCLRMLNANPPNLDGARETARRMIRDGNRASDVITRLRTLYSKKEPTLEPMDLNEAVREVIALSLSELQRNGAILQQELGDRLPIVQGDRIQLQQVILNLVRNASDAMREVEDRPRRLLIRSEHVDENVCVTVQDSGIGFDPSIADRLFESFYTTKPEGMGIGLSVSRSIIEAHGGRLWATANDSHGSTFAFSIPCEHSAEFNTEPPPARAFRPQRYQY